MTAPTCPPADDTPALRQAVIDACRRLRERGLFVGTWGNIGLRVGGGLLVTPTRLDYDAMQPEDLVLLDWEGQRIGGHRLPSSEMELHRQVLLRRGDLGAVVHTHSPYASAVAATGAGIPVIVEDMAQIIGGPVQCTTYVPGGRHRDLAAAAAASIGEDSAAVLLANHGAVVGGRDLAEALVAAEVLEKAALIYLTAQGTGCVRQIPVDQVAEERHRFLHKYGTAADQAS